VHFLPQFNSGLAPEEVFREIFDVLRGNRVHHLIAGFLVLQLLSGDASWEFVNADLYVKDVLII